MDYSLLTDEELEELDAEGDAEALKELERRMEARDRDADRGSAPEDEYDVSEETGRAQDRWTAAPAASFAGGNFLRWKKEYDGGAYSGGAASMYWLRRETEQGNPFAGYALAGKFLESGAPDDAAAAVDLLVQVRDLLTAAVTDYRDDAAPLLAETLSALGAQYERGVSGTINAGKDLKREAFRCYSNAFELDPAKAPALVRCYEEGIGVQRDEEKAFQVRQLAAKHGGAEQRIDLALYCIDEQKGRAISVEALQNVLAAGDIDSVPGARAAARILLAAMNEPDINGCPIPLEEAKQEMLNTAGGGSSWACLMVARFCANYGDAVSYLYSGSRGREKLGAERCAAELEKKRKEKAAEEQRLKREADERTWQEQKRRAAEEQQRRQAAEAEARRREAEEQQRRQEAEAEARRQAAEEKEARIKAIVKKFLPFVIAAVVVIAAVSLVLPRSASQSRSSTRRSSSFSASAPPSESPSAVPSASSSSNSSYNKSSDAVITKKSPLDFISAGTYYGECVFEDYYGNQTHQMGKLVVTEHENAEGGISASLQITDFPSEYTDERAKDESGTIKNENGKLYFSVESFWGSEYSFTTEEHGVVNLFDSEGAHLTTFYKDGEEANEKELARFRGSFNGCLTDLVPEDVSDSLLIYSNASGNTIELSDGKEYNNGICLTGFYGEATYRLDGQYTELEFTLGMAFGSPSGGTVTLSADGEPIEGAEFRTGADPETVKVDVSGVDELTVVLHENGWFNGRPIIALVDLKLG